jgi:hypothetical protein
VGYQTWIANNCRAFGLTVEEYSGWTTRGSSSFTPGGALAHWTAGPANATGRPSLATVVNGRSDLPGPLANVYLDRQGVCVIVAAGRANHAGDGGYRGLSGNSSVLGVEAECAGPGDRTAAQKTVYPVLLAALVAGVGRDAGWAARHCDWAPDRKIDIDDWPLADLQTEVAAALTSGGMRRGGKTMDLATSPDGRVTSVVVGADGQVYWTQASGRDQLAGAGYTAIGGNVTAVACAWTGDGSVLVVTGAGPDGAEYITEYHPSDGKWRPWAKQSQVRLA